MRNRVVLPACRWADDADDAALGQVEADIVEEQPVAVGLAQAAGLDDQVAEARTRRDVDLVGLVAALELLGLQFLEARQARLALGLAPLGVAERTHSSSCLIAF
jgi:hypothetical protein